MIQFKFVLLLVCRVRRSRSLKSKRTTSHEIGRMHKIDDDRLRMVTRDGGHDNASDHPDDGDNHDPSDDHDDDGH